MAVTGINEIDSACGGAGLIAPPRPGELCRVRRRLWLVNGAEPTTASGAPNTLLSLVSVEDDSLGEELRVLWELEPGAELVASSSLPHAEAFDTPQTPRLFVFAQ
ncbi:MAG: hypothetical protein EBZ48_11760, partial [Proteobacteria bacterium]|nr:hypothetical protein [Pseudomonadota bacterium]